MSNYEYTKKWKKENKDKVNQQAYRHKVKYREELKRKNSEKIRNKSYEEYEKDVEKLAKYIESVDNAF